MSYQPPDPYPPGQDPPSQPPYGQAPRYPDPPGQYAPGQELPGQFPPGPPREQPARRRTGCRGCLVGCLVTLAILVVLTVALVAAGAYVVRQMFPTTDSVQEAATCTIMRFVVTNADRAVEQSDTSAAEKAEMRRGVQDMRSELERECGPLR